MHARENAETLTSTRPSRPLGQVILYIVLFFVIIGGFATSAALGSANATWAGRINLVLIGLFIAFVLGELIHNAAVFREIKLRKIRPDAIVLRTIGNAPLTKALKRIRELNGSPRSQDTFPMFMTVVVSAEGIEFWGRQLVLDRLEWLPWACIESVESAYINESFGSGKGLMISTRVADEQVKVAFNVHSMGIKAAIPGLVYLSKGELAVVVKRFYEWADISAQAPNRETSA